MTEIEKQNTLRIKQRALMDELDKFADELTDKSNKHRVFLAWQRIRAIKINDEVADEEDYEGNGEGDEWDFFDDEEEDEE